jgi:hypothetical protein
MFAISRSVVGTLLSGMAALSIGCANQMSPSASRLPRENETTAPAQSPSLNLPGMQRTATAVGALNAMADELNTARQTVTETVAAFDELSKAQGDLVAPFERLIGLNERLDEADRRLDGRGDEMRARARDYITNWEVEVYGVEDPDLRKQADVRRTRVRGDYERISDGLRALRSSMSTFNRQADDLQTFLSQDLTPGGVRAASPAINRAQQSGKQLQQRIDELIGEVDRVATSMTPATTEPSAPVAPVSRDTSK